MDALDYVAGVNYWENKMKALELEKEADGRLEWLKGHEEGLVEGLSKGMEVGLAEGREVGLAEGREAGLAEGETIGVNSVLEKLIKDGLITPEMAAQYTKKG